MFKLTVAVLAILVFNGLADDQVNVTAVNEPEEIVYDSYRLPTAITPENYKLEVTTHLNDTEGFMFRGVVWITVSYGLKLIDWS